MLLYDNPNVYYKVRRFYCFLLEKKIKISKRTDHYYKNNGKLKVNT
jgi:hypothetical protein